MERFVAAAQLGRTGPAPWVEQAAPPVARLPTYLPSYCMASMGPGTRLTPCHPTTPTHLCGQAERGPSAMLTQRALLQLVSVSPAQRTQHRGAARQPQQAVGRRVSGGRQAFMWRLGMQANGCWMVESIAEVADGVQRATRQA